MQTQRLSQKHVEFSWKCFLILFCFLQHDSIKNSITMHYKFIRLIDEFAEMSQKCIIFI